MDYFYNPNKGIKLSAKSLEVGLTLLVYTPRTELRKTASTASALAERLEIPQEHSSLETTHNLYGFWKFAFPGTKYINIKIGKHPRHSHRGQ